MGGCAVVACGSESNQRDLQPRAVCGAEKGDDAGLGESVGFAGAGWGGDREPESDCAFAGGVGDGLAGCSSPAALESSCYISCGGLFSQNHAVSVGGEEYLTYCPYEC